MITLLRMKGSAIDNFIKRTDGTGAILANQNVWSPEVQWDTQDLTHCFQPSPEIRLVFWVSQIVEKFQQSTAPSQNVKFLGEVWNGLVNNTYLLILICLHEAWSLFFFRTTTRGNFCEKLVELFATRAIQLQYTVRLSWDCCQVWASCKIYILGPCAIIKCLSIGIPTDIMSHEMQWRIGTRLFVKRWKCWATWSHWQRVFFLEYIRTWLCWHLSDQSSRLQVVTCAWRVCVWTPGQSQVLLLTLWTSVSL